MPASDYFSARAAILESIPLVSISGRMFEERIALSLLSCLGDTSTVADSGRDYVDIAAAMATDPKARAARSDHLRALLHKSNMADMANYVLRFEEALFHAAAASASASTPVTKELAS